MVPHRARRDREEGRAPSSADDGVPRKNILLLTIDGLSYRSLGLGGCSPSPSPFLDRLHSSGVGFRRAFASGCPTQFAMPGLFLSQLPLDEGGYELGVRGRGTSFVEVLRAGGFHTAGFSTTGWFAPLFGYDRGFDDFRCYFRLDARVLDTWQRRIDHFAGEYRAGIRSLEECASSIVPVLDAMFPEMRRGCDEKLGEIRTGSIVLSSAIHNYDFARLASVLRVEEARFRADPLGYVGEMLSRPLEEQWIAKVGAYRKDHAGSTRTVEVVTALMEHGIEASRWERSASARCVLDNLLQWIDRPRTSPFFAWAHLLDAHEYSCTSFDVGDDALIAAEVDAARDLLERTREADPTFSGDVAYACAVQYVDREIERLWTALDERGLLDETVVLLTSDHGWPIGYPPRAALDITDLYDELYHVPMILVGPGLEPAAREELTSTLDVGPTLLHLAGLEAPATMRGLAVTEPGWTGHDFLYWENMGRGLCDFTTKSIKLAVRSAEHKVICSLPPLDSGLDGMVTHLFDLVLDPDEQDNLAEQVEFPAPLMWMIAVVEQRVAELKNWRMDNQQNQSRSAA